MGEDFYKGHQESYVPSVPAIMYAKSRAGVETATNRYVPLLPKHNGMLEEMAANGVELLTSLNPKWSQQKKDEAVRDQVIAFLRTRPLYKGKHILPVYTQTGLTFVYDDSRPFRIYTEIQGLEASPERQLQLVMDRPLKGTVRLPPTLLDAKDLCEGALVYDRDCVRRQLLQVQRWAEPRWVPCFTKESLDRALDAAFEACGYEVGTFPYDEGGWRAEGVTPNMIAAVCLEHELSCVIVHDDAVAHRKLFDKHRPTVQLAVYGDHAMFYDKNLKGRSQRRIRPREPPRKAVPFREQQRLPPFRKMLPFEGSVDPEKTYYTYDAEAAQKLLEGRSYIERCGKHVGDITGFTVDGARIVVVPPEAVLLQDLVDQAKTSFVYRGESVAHVCLQLFDGWLGGRAYLPPAELERLREAQSNQCAQCGEQMTDPHADHIQPVRAHGSSDASNIQLLCPNCHADKTAEEAGNLEDSCVLESQLNLETYHQFHKTVKGRQQVWGLPTAKGSKNNRDLLCADIKGCRRNCILEEPYLPRLGPVDAPQPYRGEDLYELFSRVDFAFLDIVPIFPEPLPRLPYDGKRWYHKRAALELLRRGEVKPRHVKATLTASARISMTRFLACLDKLRVALGGLRNPDGSEFSEQQVEDHVKYFFNAMLGLMDNTQIISHRRRVSNCSDDIVCADLRSFDPETNMWEMLQRVEHVKMTSLRPIAQIARDGELVKLSRLIIAAEELGQVPQAVRNDCVYCVDARDCKRLCKAANERHGDFCRPQASMHPPTNPRNNERRDHDLQLMPDDWEEELVITDGDLATQVQILYERDGMLIDSCGGSGKSTLLEAFRDHLLEKGFGVEVASYQVASALRVDGESLHKILRRSRPQYLLIDEATQVPTTLWIHVAAWKELGTKVYVFGDYSQLEAVVEPWRAAMPPTGLENSKLIRGIVGNRQMELATNWRFKDDPAHFAFLQAYRRAIKAARRRGEVLPARPEYARFPVRHDRPDHVICVSNHRRVIMNAWLNQAVKDEPGAVFFEAPENCRKLDKRPQKMWVCPGLEMIGVRGSRHVKNGARYTVVSIADRIVVKTEKTDALVTLTPAEFTKSLRLMHAMTYDQAQGLTLRDKVVWLADGDSRYMTARRLNVGYGRVTESRNLGVMNEKHQSAIARDVLVRKLL
jgi:hypothetical protein